MKSIQTRRFTLLALVFVVIHVFGMPVTASADPASDFDAAWNQRRKAAPYVRCRMETVRVIAAMSIGPGFDFPTEDTTVVEDHEFLIDTTLRRIRVESNYYIGTPQKTLAKRHDISILSPKTIVRYVLSADGGRVPMSTATIRETADQSRNRQLDAMFRFEPAMWALGYLSAEDIDRVESNSGNLEFSNQTGDGLVVSHKETPFIRYEVDRGKAFAFIRCAFYPQDSREYKSDLIVLSIESTWEQLPQGWYPKTWQYTDSSEQKSTEVLEWQFLDDVAKELWEEPQGLREPGRLIYTKDGARRLDNDLMIIPAGSYEKPRSWANTFGVLAIIVLVAGVFYYRQKFLSS